VLQRASEAIDRPRYDDIELAPAGFLVHGVEAGALVAALGTADPRHPMHCRGNVGHSVSVHWRAGLERAILAGMAYEYRVTEAADGTFPVELWSSKGGREQLVYRTHGFQTRQLAEAWIVPVEVQSATGDPPQPRARVTYLKPRRSRVVIVSKPNPHPPLASPPALPES
jgi:hypothetical protein